MRVSRPVTCRVCGHDLRVPHASPAPAVPVRHLACPVHRLHTVRPACSNRRTRKHAARGLRRWLPRKLCHLLGCLSPRSPAPSPSLPGRPSLRRSPVPRSPPVLLTPRRSRPPSSLYPGSCRPSRLGEPRRSSSRRCAPPCPRAGAWSRPSPLSPSASLCLPSRPCSPPWRRSLGPAAPPSPRPAPPSRPPAPALRAPSSSALARSGPCLPAVPEASGRHAAWPARAPAAAAPSLARCCGRTAAAPPPSPGPARAAPGPASPLRGASSSVSLAGAAAAASILLFFLFSCGAPEPQAHQTST